VPTTFVGARVVSGFRPDAVHAAAAIALSGGKMGLPVGWMLAAFAAVAAAAAGVSAWWARRST
jgi:hypothetical protein